MHACPWPQRIRGALPRLWHMMHSSLSRHKGSSATVTLQRPQITCLPALSRRSITLRDLRSVLAHSTWTRAGQAESKETPCTINLAPWMS